MSLILEALRKSEAERRRAQVPDLLTEPQVAAPVAVRAAQRWPMFAGGVVLLAAMAWFATTRNAAEPDAAAASDANAGTPVSEVTKPIVETPPTPARPAPALQRPLVVAPPAPPPSAAAQPKWRRYEDSQVPAGAPDTPPQPAPVAAFQSPPSAAVPAPGRVTDLGNDDRKQLPPLKLSMHMWNDVAAQRFVIIDGTRLRIGDHVGAVTVTDIVQDGVVLDWNGRAVKLPLP